MRKTKIICTIGPSVDNDDKIRELIVNGMDAARLNFSHGLHSEHIERIDRVRKISSELNKNVAIILDTKGPEIRLCVFENKSVLLTKGQKFTLYKDPLVIGNENGVGITYPYLGEDIEVGATILIDDGNLRMTVSSVKDGNIECIVENDGKISDRKSINIPGIDIDQSYISEDDRKDLLIGIGMNVDFIAASFVRKADDVIKLRRFLAINGGDDIRIIAKIENSKGLMNIDSIIDVSDGIMIARGDMGVEMPFEKLPTLQKMVIHKCLEKGKTVITATQMLDSMQSNPSPTRAEASDVANAIYDGTSALMLSGETAAGKYPIEALKAMVTIAEYTESQITYRERFEMLSRCFSKDIDNAISSAAVEASFLLDAKAIVICTMSGKSARLTSHYHPETSIAAICTDEKSARQLSLEYGVIPIKSDFAISSLELHDRAIDKVKEHNIALPGDLVVLEIGSTHLDNKDSSYMVIERLK